MKGFYVKDNQHIIYKGQMYYSHNPCIFNLRDKSILIVFRRAPQRNLYPSHINSESESVFIISNDCGKTWSNPPVRVEIPCYIWDGFTESILKLPEGIF